MSHPVGLVPNVATPPRLWGIVATPPPPARWPPPDGSARGPRPGAAGDAFRAAATGR